MATLLPIADCKVTDANAFLTNLSGSIGSTSITNFYYNAPRLINQTFSRNEVLTKVATYIGGAPANKDKSFIMSLTESKSCTAAVGPPSVFTVTSHGYTTGDKVRFSGNAPTGMISGIAYYVNVQSINTFWLYDTYSNAIAGGVTGRIAITTTGSAFFSNKIVEEKTINCNDVYGLDVLNVSSASYAYIVFEGWNTLVDTTASKWAFLISVEDPTMTGTNDYGFASGTFLTFGTQTATAVTNVDGFFLNKVVDFSPGFIINSQTCIASNNSGDEFLNPYFLVDPTQSTLGNLTIAAGRTVLGATKSVISFGKPIKFTNNLSTGNTSATLVSNFNGVTGTYLVQLLPLTDNDPFVQVNMNFTNGSTNVTFSSLSANYQEKAGICLKTSQNYTVFSNSSTSIFQNSGSLYQTFMIWGETDREPFGLLLENVSIGSNTIKIDRPTGWKNGDKIVVGGGVSTSGADLTEYTISTITTASGVDTITLTTNIASYNRKANNQVILSTPTNSAFQHTRISQFSSLRFGANARVIYIFGANLKNCNIEYNIGLFLSDAQRFYMWKVYNTIYNLSIGEGGIRYEKISASISGGGSVGTYSRSKATSTSIVKDYAAFNSSVAFKFPQNARANFTNMYFESGFAIVCALGLYSFSSINNLRIFCNNNNTALQIDGLYSRNIQNVYIDNASYGLYIGICSNAKIDSIYSGVNAANVYDIGFLVSPVYADIEINKMYNSFTVDTTYRQDGLIDGSSVRLTNINGVENESRLFQKYGETRISGLTLSDTENRNSNNTLVVLPYSANSETFWRQQVPTGNIQGKDMVVGIWCKISDSSYWGGVNTMPRLTVEFDNGSVAYTEAGQTTDWQYLFVPIKPNTSSANIFVKYSGATDAAYPLNKVYFASSSILYPQGVTVNLGEFNYLTSGLPVSPTISTSISPLDVWAANPTQFGANTVGDKVNKIKNDSGLIPALL